MKIRSVKIGSFGAVRDREYNDLSPGMNVIFGKNESGKTTLMEFIRSTLFPDGKRKTYPQRSKKDEGTVVIEMNDGSKSTVSFDNNTPVSGVDSATYRNIFAMTSDDLGDFKLITSGEIGSRFLTVPGGRGLPGIIDSIEKEMQDLHTSDRRSDNTKIGKKLSDLRGINAALNTVKDEDSYSRLFSERRIIESELAELKKEESVYSKHREVANIQRSQSVNVGKLDELKTRYSSLSDSDIIKDGDREKYDTLKAAVNGKTSILTRIRNRESEYALPVGCNADAVIRNKERIRDLELKAPHVPGLLSKRAELKNKEGKQEVQYRPQKAPKTPVSSPTSGFGKFAPILLIVGIIVIIAGVLVNPIISIGGAVLALIGGYLFYTSRNGVKGSTDEPSSITTPPQQDSVDPASAYRAEIEAIDRKVSGFKNELEEVAGAVGIERTTDLKDVQLLSDLLEKSLERRRISAESAEADKELKDALYDLRFFVADFGGEERFIELLKRQDEKQSLAKQISTLDDSIRLSGYDPNAVVEAVPDSSEVSERISELNKSLGAVTSEMSNVIDDVKTEKLMDSRASAVSELKAMARKWGVLSVASQIIEYACEDIYSNVQPDVVKTADKLFVEMTGGRYHLIIEPRTSLITVVSSDQKKEASQWSSGLGDQVKLSLKMAVARELSEERLPILLDDVLLNFDSERKRGACRALLGLSEDMQIFLFTCDQETAWIMKQEGDPHIITL